MGNKQIILTPKTSIDFTIYFEPYVDDENIEKDISSFSIENIDKMKNYYSSKYFKFIFDKILKNDLLKYRIINVNYEDNMFKIDGEVLLKSNTDNIDISFDDIDTYIKKTFEENSNDFKLKINEENIECNIELEINDIEYEFNDNLKINNNKHVKIIKPRRKNELYEKERIINKDFKFKR